MSGLALLIHTEVFPCAACHIFKSFVYFLHVSQSVRLSWKGLCRYSSFATYTIGMMPDNLVTDSLVLNLGKSLGKIRQMRNQLALPSTLDTSVRNVAKMQPFQYQVPTSFPSPLRTSPFASLTLTPESYFSLAIFTMHGRY